MKRGASRLCALLLAASAVACGGDSAESSPSATLEDPTTTTTLSVEAEVEAAYLRSWDVYADAVLTFDTSKLATAYSGPALEVVSADVEELRQANTPARMDVDHDYEIEVDVESGLARVIDRYKNHSVLLDGETKATIEPDPDELIEEEYLMQNTGGAWKVIDISPS